MPLGWKRSYWPEPKLGLAREKWDYVRANRLRRMKPEQTEALAALG